MKSPLFVALVLLASLAHAPLRAAGDAAAGETAYNARGCVGCHGPAGKQPLPTYPVIGGKSGEYLVTELNKFRSGERNNPIMRPMASMLSEADVANLASYLAAQ